ncbi:DUF3107 domain-containing protein [Nocardioides seonyuensis]|uniref:DUF3107 domain-containing protein n=1 Tax=Nocardioides seonyuensis TaxID=2518371 RepID=A0A4P7IGK0_9ACTN|nr:DUF3107 domain-containing protein [Nocardioides seonyuensis]QBX56378.1 DUF3107 domain-containing protein [Nocardioides seonyuensis]
MEVKIGVLHASRELVVDTDIPAEEVQSRLEEALSNNATFRLEDNKGRAVVVPSDKVAYLELGVATSGTVGFR